MTEGTVEGAVGEARPSAGDRAEGRYWRLWIPLLALMVVVELLGEVPGFIVVGWWVRFATAMVGLSVLVCGFIALIRLASRTGSRKWFGEQILVDEASEAARKSANRRCIRIILALSAGAAWVCGSLGGLGNPGELWISADGERVILRGRIDGDMDNKAVRLLTKAECYPSPKRVGCPSILDIASGGGNIVAATNLLHVLSQAGVNRIAVAGECESACASILFAGFRERGMVKGALLGVHSSSVGFLFDWAGDTTPYTGASNSTMLAYMKSGGFEEACAAEMLSHGPELTILDAGQVAGQGVEVCLYSGKRGSLPELDKDEWEKMPSEAADPKGRTKAVSAGAACGGLPRREVSPCAWEPSATE